MDYSETNTELFQADSHTRLLSRQWLTEKKMKAVFIGVHGAMTHSGDWEIPALYFKEKGINTYAFDLRWHGTYNQYNKNGRIFFHIDGYMQNVNDVYNYYLNISKKNPDVPVFLISHSYGSAIALLFGLLKKETDIKGIIISSPWLKNKVYVHPMMKFLAKIIYIFNSKFSVKTENLVEKVTHDRDMIERHYSDQRAGLRGTKATTGTAVEMIRLQNYITGNIKQWDKYPLFAVVAGDDKLADPEVSMRALKNIPGDLLELYYYENNFHENYFEPNKEEIFNNINKWVNRILSRS